MLDAPVVERWQDAGVDSDYRLPGDPPHVIRLRQDWAEGACAEIACDVPVVGSAPDARRNLAAFVAGKERRIRLERSAGADAVAVIGRWNGRPGRCRSGRLGWLPSDLAKALKTTYGATALCGRIRRIVQDPAVGSTALKVDVGRPMRRRSDAK